MEACQWVTQCCRPDLQGAAVCLLVGWSQHYSCMMAMLMSWIHVILRIAQVLGPWLPWGSARPSPAPQGRSWRRCSSRPRARAVLQQQVQASSMAARFPCVPPPQQQQWQEACQQRVACSVPPGRPCAAAVATPAAGLTAALAAAAAACGGLLCQTRAATWQQARRQGQAPICHTARRSIRARTWSHTERHTHSRQQQQELWAQDRQQLGTPTASAPAVAAAGQLEGRPAVSGVTRGSPAPPHRPQVLPSASSGGDLCHKPALA
jgi:hypothetical protein